MMLDKTGGSTLSTVTPTASVRAVALLASACTLASKALASLALVALIMATTLTLATVTLRLMASAATSTELARPALKPS